MNVEARTRHVRRRPENPTHRIIARAARRRRLGVVNEEGSEARFSRKEWARLHAPSTPISAGVLQEDIKRFTGRLKEAQGAYPSMQLYLIGAYIGLLDASVASRSMTSEENYRDKLIAALANAEADFILAANGFENQGGLANRYQCLGRVMAFEHALGRMDFPEAIPLIPDHLL